MAVMLHVRRHPMPQSRKPNLDSTSQALVNATRQVLVARDSEQVMERILASAQELLHAEGASLFLVNNRKRCLEMAVATNLPKKVARSIRVPLGHGVAGWVAKNNESVRVKDISQDQRFFSGVDEKTGMITKGYLCVPLSVDGRVIGTLQVLNQTKGGGFSERDQARLEAFSVIAALAINKSRLQEAEMERRRMRSELEVAKAFQQRLIPHDFNPPEGIKVAGYYQPAREMGGDTYDAIHTPDGYIVLIGDVSGKGPGAALWMSGFATIINYLEENGEDPFKHLEKIDKHMNSVMPWTAFITTFIAKIHKDHMHYVSFGHNSMLLLDPNKGVKWLESTGLPLGAMPDMPKTTVQVDFPAGSLLVMFTDGVTEAENEHGDMYGEDRLSAIVLKNRDLEPEELVKKIFRSIKSFTKGAEQSDDITLMVVKKA